MAKKKISNKENTNVSIWPQTMLTFALVIITGCYACQTGKMVDLTKKSVDNSEKMVKEMKLAREQQLKPYIFVHFYWVNDLEKFFSVVRNLGGGIAQDIEYSYSYHESEFRKFYKILAPGEEVVDNTILGVGRTNYDKSIKVEVEYKDSFGNIIKEEFSQNLIESINNPLPSKFATSRREIETSINQKIIAIWIEGFLKNIDNLNNQLKEIKEVLKDKK